MNIAKAEALLGSCLQNFANYIGKSMNIAVHLLSRQDVKDRRTEIIQELGAEFEPFGESTLGESICGSNGTAMLIYPFNIFSAQEFEHTVYHECGHWHFREANPELTQKQQAPNGLSRTVQLGYTLFDEFIAEVQANLATKDTSTVNEENKRMELIHLLYQSLPGVNPEHTEEAILEKQAMLMGGVFVLPAGLGRYAAMILTDPTLVPLMRRNPQFDRGFAAIGSKIAFHVQEILVILSDHLQKRGEAVVVSEEPLQNLGRHVEQIWEIRQRQKLT